MSMPDQPVVFPTYSYCCHCTLAIVVHNILMSKLNTLHFHPREVVAHHTVIRNLKSVKITHIIFVEFEAKHLQIKKPSEFGRLIKPITNDNSRD